MWKADHYHATCLSDVKTDWGKPVGHPRVDEHGPPETRWWHEAWYHQRNELLNPFVEFHIKVFTWWSLSMMPPVTRLSTVWTMSTIVRVSHRITSLLLRFIECFFGLHRISWCVTDWSRDDALWIETRSDRADERSSISSSNVGVSVKIVMIDFCNVPSCHV